MYTVLGDQPHVSLTIEQTRLVFSQLSQIGPILCERLKEAAGGDLKKIFNFSYTDLISIPGIGPSSARSILSFRSQVDLEAMESQLQQHQAQFIIPESHHFPPLLQHIPDKPIGLYQQGPWVPHNRCISIVGSRQATLYGLSTAKKLAIQLAEQGFTIVSGLARGIDAAAHEGALLAGGSTVAVLGNGLDIVYPPENKNLYAKIRDQGALISEFAFGHPASRQTFPLRNRIIAGISMATIVVESDIHAGSMITARLAGEYGRHLFAVPGRIDQASSRGCHALIRDGATLVTCVEDCLEALLPIGQMDLLGLGPQKKKTLVAHTLPEHLSTAEKTIWNTLFEKGPCTADDLSTTLNMPIHTLSGHLLSLEVQKLLVKRIDGLFEV